MARVVQHDAAPARSASHESFSVLAAPDSGLADRLSTGVLARRNGQEEEPQACRPIRRGRRRRPPWGIDRIHIGPSNSRKCSTECPSASMRGRHMNQTILFALEVRSPMRKGEPGAIRHLSKGAGGINPVREDCGPVVERRPGSSYQDRREIRRASVEVTRAVPPNAPGAPMQSADAAREPLPVASDAERSMPDARRKVTGRAEGQ